MPFLCALVRSSDMFVSIGHAMKNVPFQAASFIAEVSHW